MALNKLLQALDSNGHRRLQEMVALGRWPDGRGLSDEEKAACLQALIAYEASLPESEHSGYIAQRCGNDAAAQYDAQQVRLTS